LNYTRKRLQHSDDMTCVKKKISIYS